MSLDKAIAHGKEHRKGYAERGKPGRFDQTCRPHGGIQSGPSCERSRPFRQTLRLDALVMTQDPDFPARFVGAA